MLDIAHHVFEGHWLEILFSPKIRFGLPQLEQFRLEFDERTAFELTDKNVELLTFSFPSRKELALMTSA